MPTPRILIADDDRDMVRLLSMCLRREGYEVYAALDGCQAVDFAHKCRPDLLILDINMPAGGGLSVQRRIEKSGTLCGSPIIYFTGDKSDKVLEDAASLGAFRLLYKPLDTPQLLHAVHAALGGGARVPSDRAPAPA